MSRTPDFALSFKTPDFAPSSETPGGYVGQAGIGKKRRTLGGEPLFKMAGLSEGSRRLPGITQRASIKLVTQTQSLAASSSTSATMANLGSFPGAACCKPIELPPYKAAPLQALGVRRRGVH